MILDIQKIEMEAANSIATGKWMALRCDPQGKRVLLRCHNPHDLLRFGRGVFNDPFSIIYTAQANEPARTLIFGDLWRIICCFVRNTNWPSASLGKIQISPAANQIVADAALIRAVVQSVMPDGQVEAHLLPISHSAAQFAPSRPVEPSRVQALPIMKCLDEVRREIKRWVSKTKPSQSLKALFIEKSNPNAT